MEEAEGGEEMTEMWYQLPAEEDGSTFFPTLSETGMRGEQTSFPSMEEGTIQSEADLQSGIPGGRTLPLQLDFQDSRLSPCLPLLTSGSIPGHKFFDDTLFQQTETEFASLRASLDMSEFPGPGYMSLQMTDALRLASKEVLMVQEEDTLSSTQQYQDKSPDGHLDLSSNQYLSEHPLNVSHGDKEDDTITENVHSDSGVLKTMDQPSVEDLMAEDGAFLGSNVPAPVLLELLEKEVGLSAGSGSSSRRSSQTVSTSEADNIDVLSQGPREDKVGILEAQARTKTPTGLHLEEEETFRDSSEIQFDDPELERANLSVPGHLDQSGITLRQSSTGLRDELQKQLCAEIQQERKKREMSKFHKSRIDSSPSSQNATDLPENITKPSDSGEDTAEEHPRGEFSRSSHCIERGHKELELSRAVNTPIDEASFIGRLAYPISQSTPGTFSMNRKPLSGRIQQIKAKLTGSDMSLNEEPNSSSSNPNVASSGVHQSVQSSQGYPESSDSQRSPSPQRKKIQSLPSLTYIEKVGSWNTNQSFDTLVLRGLTGVSPKKLAYNAVADSLNRMLSKQTDSSTLKKGLDASIKGTSSMTNLNVEHVESSITSKLTRSQSYNSVMTAVGGNQALKRTEENIDPVAEEEEAKLSTLPFESLQTHAILSQDISGNETKHPNKGASMGKNDTAHSPPDYAEHLEKSNHEREKRLDESSRPPNKSLITIEHFSDVSLDQEFSGSSHTSDHVGDVLQDSVGSSVLGMSHHQGEPLMQVWSGEGATREKEWLGEGATQENKWSGEGATREKEWLGEGATREEWLEEGATREKEWLEEGATREKEWSGGGVTREKEWSGEGATREKEWSGEGATREKEWSGEGATREKEWSGEGATPEKEWSGEEATPEDEFNIEERIPTYLRNLGINQSPTTILMPFNPKGPIREPEFSPSDLRTIKSSNATPNRSMRLSEGESQNGANISQSSLYSTASTTSVSIPMGSEVGPGSPLPTELSPQFSSRSTNDRPISQDDTATRGVSGNQEVYSVQALDGERRQGSPDPDELNDLGATRQVLHDIQEVAEDSTRVEQRIEEFESAGPEVGQANLEHLNLGSLSSSLKKPHHMDSTNDSFVGSKTLKEIRKLLEEADDVNLDRTTSDFNPKSSLRDPSITSPAMSQSFRDSLKSGASNSRSASPLDLQLNNLSWDTSFNSSVTSDNLLYKGSSAKADLHWKDPISGFSPVGDSFYLKDISKDGLHLPAPFSLHKHGRSEPEGSSEATAIRMAPASVHLQDSRARRTVNLREEGLRSEQLLSSVTRAVGGLKQVLDVTGSSNLRSTGEESNASSGDTLAAQVRSLLKNGKVRSTGEESDASSGDSLAGQVKSLLKSGKLRSTGEESDASSGDSLAARVKSLLKSNTLSSTSQVRQTAEDENQRSHGSVKLKLAGQPTPTDGDLSEEDRRRIEEIKRELLDHAKGADKSRQHSTFEPGPSRGSEHFRLQLTPSPQLDQYHVPDSQGSSEDHIIPLPASTRCGSSEVHPRSMTVGNIKAVATVTLQSDEPTLICSQLQQGLTPDLHTPLADRSASDLDKKNAHANKYGEEASKPIASITFSSRKRSSPLPNSARLETAELSSATRHFDYAKSLADPYDKDRSRDDPYDKGRTRADPYDNDRSRADPYNNDRSRADPYDNDRSRADPYDKDRSRSDPYDKDSSRAAPYDKDRSRADPYDKDRSRADPYDKDRSRADPYDKDRSRADPYDKDRSHADPYDKDRSRADPYDKDRSRADQYDKDRSRADPYDKDRSRADPYDKDRSRADPYDKDRSRADPYDKDRSRADQYDKVRSRADPYDKVRSRADPYDKDRSRADPYDKDRSRADPYDKERSRADPYDKDRSRTDQYDKDRSRADQYDKDRSRADQYDKDRSRADQYDKDRSCADQYDKDRSRADQYDKDGSRADQYDKDGSCADPYYQDELHADPYYSYKPRAIPYDKDNSQADTYYKDKPGADPHDKGRPCVDPYYKDGPHADQYDKDTSQADPYYKDKPCADPYEKEKPHVDPQYKEKQLADLLYKDHQPSETSRSNFMQCPSPMHNMLPQNLTILDLPDNGGVLNRSKTVVSEHRGQSEVFKNHIQPDPSSMVVRNSSMNEDSFVPPVARPSKPIGLQEDKAGPSHSALVAGRPMNEPPPQILNVSTKEWKIYPEQIFTAKIQRDGTYEFPSQELKTEPTSPTRKALSCIRVTISPKEDLNISSVMMATGTGDDAQTFTSSPAMAENEQVSSHGLSSVPSSPYFLHSPPSASQGEGRTNSEGNVHMEDKENIPDKTTTKTQRQVPLYDATTQITTESPEKTTFSAEIYIDGSLKEASSSTVVQTQKTPEGRSRTPFFSISRATDQPLLLPYRPQGSPELYYIPAMHGGSRMSPVSTIESSHPGSNDAVSPKFPAEVLGSAAEKISSDASIPHHSDGIYSKDHSPKTAWEDRATEKRKTLVTGPFHDDNKASYCSLQHKVSHPEPGSKDIQREKRDARSAREDEEFFPLKPEVDYTPAQQSSMGSLKKIGHHDITDYPRRRDQQEQTRGTPLHSPNSSWDFKVGVKEKHVRYEDHSFSSDQPTNPTKSFQKTESTLSQSALSNQSLDDLWARYTDRRRSHLSESSNNLEVSLVERLDRLARLLQNPKPYLATKDDKDEEQVLKVNKKDHEKSRETKKEEREKWYLRKFGVDARPVNVTSENQDGSVSRLSVSASSERVLHGDSYSDFSSEVRSSATEESAGGSEAATQTDSTSTFTTNSTISTIDTVRLINAFGPERVRPSSKLSRLYNTIDLQKKRSEGTSKKGSRSSASRGHSTMEIKDLHKSLNKMADTDSVSSGSSWEPVMRSKNGCKVLNKGIQTGDPEIVTSATKRHTRDVGTTFPSPEGEMLKPSAEREMPAHSCSSGVRRPKSKQYIPPGLSWFVPADGTKCDSPKENKLSGPGPAWYESPTNAKPWREPLRERNQQGPATRRGESLNIGSEPGKDNKMVQPFVRATLQELLKAHRPDFIFQSGERVKRLQLLTKERKLQNIFQSEREALFNQPERRGRPPYHTSYKESKTSQKMKNIPRGEMVQRSKRIYEQLPEIKKRKEEEKRRSEYETYRLKAQLFRKKVTNHILGRKTPWN